MYIPKQFWQDFIYSFIQQQPLPNSATTKRLPPKRSHQQRAQFQPIHPVSNALAVRESHRETGNGDHQPRNALGPRGSGAMLGTSVRGEDEEGGSWRGRRRACEPAPRRRGGGGPRPLLVQEDRRAIWTLRTGVLQGVVLKEVQGRRRVHRETGRVPVHLLPPPVDTAADRRG